MRKLFDTNLGKQFDILLIASLIISHSCTREQAVSIDLTTIAVKYACACEGMYAGIVVCVCAGMDICVSMCEE